MTREKTKNLVFIAKFCYKISDKVLDTWEGIERRKVEKKSKDIKSILVALKEVAFTLGGESNEKKKNK